MRERIVRHAGVDRLIHWLIAASVLVLLATAFLPVLGVEFAWVAVHWWTGFVLIAAVLAHILRALIMKPVGTIWIGRRDLQDALAIVRRTFRLGAAAEPRPGKYSFAQKFIHLAFTVVVLAGVATGATMMVKVDTPWWDRNPYRLSDAAWGIVYVVHGLAALSLVTMVMTHVYFALRPEKLMFLRSMIAGWITRAEFERRYDPKRWRVPE
jgi:formate dehydrogenase subunit gamma